MGIVILGVGLWKSCGKLLNVKRACVGAIFVIKWYCNLLIVSRSNFIRSR